tara:strand:+ start:12169 stop:12585 length:417 start_codon:yes stop_codon:yes gene_type:complete
MKLVSCNQIDIKHRFCPDDYQMSLITDIVNDSFFVKGFKCERVFGDVNIETQLILAIKERIGEGGVASAQNVKVFIKQVSGEYYAEFTEFKSAYCGDNHDRSIYCILAQMKEAHGGSLLFYAEDFYSDAKLIKEYGDL